MKKALILGFVIALIPISAAWAGPDGRTDAPPWRRPGIVMGRGALNLAGLPAEFVSTFRREREWHSRLWPVTYVPRLGNNIILRLSSAAHDLAIFPFYSPFTDDLSPLTEPMGLPAYPWQT